MIALRTDIIEQIAQMLKGQDKNRCIVVGAGIAGLAVAIRLSAMGRKVHIFEANSTAGGKISEKCLGKYRFDTGPSVLTKPELISDLFQLHGKDISDYLEFQKLDPLFKFFFSDGTSFETWSDRQSMVNILERKTTEPPENVFKVLRDSKVIYDLTHQVFLERSLHKIRNYFNLPTLRGILQFNKIRAFQTMHQYNVKNLKDKRLVQVFDRYASYNGSNPFKAPATLNVISHIEINEGAYFPKGGMQQIVRALLRLAQEVGVEIHLNESVEELVVAAGNIKGIRTKNGVIESSCVICNVDIHAVYNKLLPGALKPKLLLDQPRSSSVIVFLLGIGKRFPSLNLHNTFFTADDKAEYDAIFSQGDIIEDPTIYLYNSSSHHSSDAPEGKSNWFVMVTAPSIAGQDWNELVLRTKKNVFKKLSAALGENIELLIEEEEVISPLEIESSTGAWKGSVYGNSSNGIFSAFLRHPNFSRKNRGLYFCGGSVHPGPGIPLCLLSSKIVSELIAKDFKN